jgi:hypothetical protein
LFWRKKQTPKESDLFEFETKERRKFFRVRPAKGAPISFVIDQKKAMVQDIGAAGLSFKNNEFKQGEKYPVTIRLPEIDGKVITDLLLITIDDKGFCHCKFKNIDPESTERVHQYVLKRQKEILQQRKKARMKSGGAAVQLKPEETEKTDEKEE